MLGSPDNGHSFQRKSPAYVIAAVEQIHLQYWNCYTGAGMTKWSNISPLGHVDECQQHQFIFRAQASV